MNDLIALKTTLLRIQRVVTARLARAVGRESRLRIRPAARPFSTSTRGWGVSIATLPDGLSAQLWLDHYAGQDTPRLWYGMHSDRAMVRRLASAAARVGYRKPPLVIQSRDVVQTSGARHFYRLRNALSRGQFDRLVDERYPGADGYYFGVYYPRWPLSAAVNDAAEAAARFFASTPVALDSARNGMRAADADSERAAIRHVTAFLRQAGYRVWSREAECCGYDLLAVRDDGELHVEVKGTSAATPSFYITANEWDIGMRDTRWRLAVADSVKTRPVVHWFSMRAAQDLFVRKPKLWFCSPRKPIPGRYTALL